MAVKKSYDDFRIDLFENRKGEWIEMSIGDAAAFNLAEVAKCIADKTYQGDFLIPVPMDKRSDAGKILYGKTEEN